MTTKRKLKQPKYKSFKLSKRIKHPYKLKGAFRITADAAKLLWLHKKLFIGITVLYGLLNILLVTGISHATDVTALKSNLESLIGGGSALTSSLAVLAVLVGSTGTSSSGAAGAYQLMLSLVVSLAIIWALREVMTGAVVRVRDAYYRGMQPLVPFVLVLCVIALQLIPFIIGATLYSIVTKNGIAIYLLDKVIWGTLFGLLTVLSVYMISSSVFALYIVTLPNMTPLKALRSARQLVLNRRWTVLRKVLLLPVLLSLILVAIMLPVILFAAVIAQWVFFALTMVSLAAVHSYLYHLYRELLHE